MKTLYGLNEQQMRDVYLIVERHYLKEDLELAIENLEVEKNITIELTEVQKSSIIDNILETIEDSVSYSVYARVALLDYLADKEMGKV